MKSEFSASSVARTLSCEVSSRRLQETSGCVAALSIVHWRLYRRLDAETASLTPHRLLMGFLLVRYLHYRESARIWKQESERFCSAGGLSTCNNTSRPKSRIAGVLPMFGLR